MDNIKRDEYYISNMIKDINYILKKIQNISYNEFKEDEMLVDSICFRFIQISESASKISDDIINKYKNIPWNHIRGLRNRIVHDYGNVDYQIVYMTANNDLKQLLELLELI